MSCRCKDNGPFLLLGYITLLALVVVLAFGIRWIRQDIAALRAENRAVQK